MLLVGCVGFGCAKIDEQPVETIWQPDIKAISYTLNGRSRPDVRETDRPMPAITVAEGDLLQFTGFLCEMRPMTQRYGIFSVNTQSKTPVPPSELSAEARVIVTPPIGDGQSPSDFVGNSATTKWRPVSANAWQIGGVEHPIRARKEWYYVKIQLQVRKPGEPPRDVRPEMYLRIHSGGFLGH